ncbi:predicted protein [Chaetomium globosum CBS 148.51]|uniref:Uncharacterized protein n=1 Tax=Chaetomium globosum (strain ATCC 6205 / CBS 148.51 / DSM 1962 / NBRC 6347 / NRRL 1970) TaxID=306901 RepID=Q2H2P3_CHAGB|nr:uncharacterized protein CHGG_03953 [Chaetomium globosum CBS 148.51]EAQ87334.1 predicted protein [Chaetomium globosum CBS 148.51]
MVNGNPAVGHDGITSGAAAAAASPAFGVTTLRMSIPGCLPRMFEGRADEYERERGASAVGAMLCVTTLSNTRSSRRGRTAFLHPNTVPVKATLRGKCCDGAAQMSVLFRPDDNPLTN